MSESARRLRRRERVYLGLGALGPVLALSSYFAAWPPLPSLQPTMDFLKAVNIGGVIVSLLVPLGIHALFALADGRPLMFLRKGLSARVGRPLSEDEAAGAIEQLSTRAAALGMSFSPDHSVPDRWHLDRAKKGQVHEFRDNAFTGTASLSTASSGGRELSVDMTFLDRLLVESGEREQLENLCRELVGLETLPMEKQVPLVLLMGWFHGLACAAGAVALGLGLSTRPSWLIGPALVGAGLFIYSAVVILKKRSRLTGLWLIVQGLVTIGLSTAVFLLRGSES